MYKPFIFITSSLLFIAVTTLLIIVVVEWGSSMVECTMLWGSRSRIQILHLSINRSSLICKYSFQKTSFKGIVQRILRGVNTKLK
jgi:hypothetical protein